MGWRRGDHGAMVIEPGKASAGTGAMVSETGACSRPAIRPGRARTGASQYADCREEPCTIPVCVLAIGLNEPPA